MNFFPEAQSVCPNCSDPRWLILHFSGFQPNPELSGDIRLYITLMMKMDKLPLPSAGSKVFGLEVCNSLVLFYERSDRWQLWLVWCCVKLWNKYCGRILSQFLHNLVIANWERKRQLKNEFVLSAVHFFCILLQNSFTGIFKPLKYNIHLNTVLQPDLQMLRCTEWSPRYIFPFCFPQVLLRSLEAPVSSQMGPLVATGRIVADWKEYKYIQLTLF